MRDGETVIDPNSIPERDPDWIENEDGSGQWSDGWDGPIVGLSDEEYRNLPIEDRSMDAFAPGVIDNLDIDIDDSV